MDTKVNLAEKLALLDGPFRPGIVGTLNDYKLAVVKVHGEFVWHKHDDTDDFFLVLSGRLTIQLRDRDVELPRASCSWCRAASSTARGPRRRPRAPDRARGHGQHRRRRRGADGAGAADRAFLRGVRRRLPEVVELDRVRPSRRFETAHISTGSSPSLRCDRGVRAATRAIEPAPTLRTSSPKRMVSVPRVTR